MPDAVMLFAAGFGTRMGALTANRPKPLIEVAGRALIDHALDAVEAFGTLTCVVNAHYRAEQLARHLEGRPDLRLSIEAPTILDTGGGLRHALPLLGADPVFTLNTDAVWTGSNPLRTLAAQWDPVQMDALLLLVPTGRARGRFGDGDFALEASATAQSESGPTGRLTRGGDLVYTGAQILKTAPVAAHGPGAFSLNAIWDGIAAQGRLFGTLHAGGWADVGHPGGIALAESMLREAGQ